MSHEEMTPEKKRHDQLTTAPNATEANPTPREISFVDVPSDFPTATNLL